MLPKTLPLLAVTGFFLTHSTVEAADVTWDGSTSSDWFTGSNWDNNSGPVEGDVVIIDSGTVTFATDTSENFRSIRQSSGIFNFSSGTFKATFQSSWDSFFDGTVNHTGTDVQINELEIGRSTGTDGVYYLSGGSLEINRGLNGNSLYLGGNRRGNNAGTGTLEISGGSFITRTGVKLGHATNTGTGNFTVLGSGASEIGIGTSGNNIDGVWEQHGGSTLKVGIDSGGLSKIFIDDRDGATSATFESGSILDVDYYDGGSGGGTWTVMEIENGDITDNGLAFDPGVDTSIWSFSIDNTGSNGFLRVTAEGEPANLIQLNVGSTKKQTMRYGMDYERLWYWTNSMSSAEKDMVSRWSVVDCDIDYIRVAINSKYELTEGEFDRSAYTSKIWPMMRDMQDANPDIKFFASPRPLNEAISGAAWQPYPRWITGDPGNGDFDFDSEKCSEYLVRYIELMKTEGFKISYLDVTNEWQSNVSGGRVTPSDVSDIAEYLKDNLDPEDMPLIIAPSAWSYSQSRSWMSGVDTTRKRNAIDIAAGHNTDKTGTAQEFADRVNEIFPDKDIEIWNTELHGWKSTSGADEVLTSSFMFEAIRAGFSGLSGWLAIGTTNQGHAYILNPSGNPARNVKYFIFNKLTNTSHRGQALDINQPAAFKTTCALIRDDLLTVWIINDSNSQQPIQFNSADRTISSEGITVTRWSEQLAVEGATSSLPAHSSNQVRATIEPGSLYCFEVPLSTGAAPFTTLQAEDFDAMSGIRTEDTTDEDGGQNVGYISHGDWLRFDDLAPGDNAAIRFRVAARSGQPLGKIEVRLGSPTGALVGTANVPDTNGWQTWQTIETTLDPIVGTHDIYLSFVEDAATPTNGSMFNLNWLAIQFPLEPEQFAITSASIIANNVSLTLPDTNPEFQYQIETSNDLNTDWQPLGNQVPGNGTTLQLVAPVTFGQSENFYRVRVWQ